jgi:Ion channel
MKEKSKLLKYINDVLKLSLGFERLFFFIMVFLILQHIGTCLWIIMATLYSENFEETWLYKYKIEQDMNNFSIYLTSFYWTITTVTTVGYGDIGGNNNLERFFCAVMMIIGVIAFSFANGSLTSII